MPTLIQRGATWLGGRMKTAAGRSVTIRQGAKPPFPVTGWMSMHEETVVNSEGFATRVTSYEWSFLASDLGTLVLRKGDVITDVDTEEKFEVLPPAENKPAVERLDTSKLLIKANTKLVA